MMVRTPKSGNLSQVRATQLIRRRIFTKQQ